MRVPRRKVLKSGTIANLNRIPLLIIIRNSRLLQRPQSKVMGTSLFTDTRTKSNGKGSKSKESGTVDGVWS